MVKLIIRDDDLNYFSRVDDLKHVYEEISSFPISFAVIPMVTDVSTYGKCPDTFGNIEPQWIGDNLELSTWLKSGLAAGSLDVLMHGITHKYCVDEEGGRKPEMVWRNEKDLTQEIISLKERLEALLDHPITVFVAPSNTISKYAIKCVAQCNFDFSGIVPLSFQRDLSVQNIYSYLKRLFVRACYKIPYPGVLRYSDHFELNASGNHDYNYLIRLFHYCDKRNLPLAINVHYWHIRDNYNEYRGFFDFIKYALDHGALPATMSEVINQYKGLNENS